MYPSLETKLARYEQLEQMLQDPEVSSDPAKFLPLQREQGGLVRVARAMKRYHALKDDVDAARAMLSDSIVAATLPPASWRNLRRLTSCISITKPGYPRAAPVRGPDLSDRTMG